MKLKLGVVVPTLNAGMLWPDWLAALASQSLHPDRVLVVDSSSTDNTGRLARELGLELRIIQRREFNHGGTRQSAAEWLEDQDVIVYLTQDAILADNSALASIAAAFTDPNVGVAYGRQLPRSGASPIETHARMFSYPDQSYVLDEAAARKLGVRGPFLSNSFSAYRRRALLEVGGFPSNVIVSEDMYVGARMLMAGWKLAYCADARVRHSHSYTLLQEFKRYFDVGVFNARESWIREHFGGASAEGRKFVISEWHYLLTRSPWRLPESCIRTVLKLSGFNLGLREAWLPLWLKRLFSLQGYFWTQSDTSA